jgi:coenzyme F420-0:L-glutamate ligase / coenzyme F420-1:gamma-L-glutamate ligase
MGQPSFSATALPGIPLVQAGDDLCRLILASLEQASLCLEEGDVVVLAQKIVSKAEGRQIALATVSPGPQAAELAERTGKDARLVELILSEAEEVVRVAAQLVIVRHRLGLVLANAGIDQSNVADGEVLLLPENPDASAARLREALLRATGKAVAVLVIDSLGRAWRVGTVGTAIGVAGIPAVLDLRGRCDLNGRKLQSSDLGLADEIAAAASLIMGQADEGTPVVLIRGLRWSGEAAGASSLVRPRHMDLFP